MDKEASILKVLSDPIRLRLAALLAVEGEICVCKLVSAVGLPQYAVSRQLGLMRAAGLVEARRQGTWMYYKLADPSCPLQKCIYDFLAGQFADDPTVRADRQRLNETGCRNKITEKPMKKKLAVLFLCTGNSCRSQMAEGWCRHLKGDVIEPYSAGIETHGLNPNAVKVMAEAGVDISGHRSKNVNELKDVAFDYVVTVCGHANEHCPMFSGKAKVVHVGFDDPPAMAKSAKTEQEALNCYRRVRDQIRLFIETLPEGLQ